MSTPEHRDFIVLNPGWSRKICMAVMLLGSLMPFCPSAAVAGNSDLAIQVVPRRVSQDQKHASEGGVDVTKEQWVYDVTIENRTFKDLTDLQVTYRIFSTQEKMGAKDSEALKHTKGSIDLPLLKPHEKKVLVTDQVEVVKQHLVGNYIYSSGAKPNANGTLGGLWLRVQHGGQQFAEYANPSTLMKEKWD